MTDAEIYEQLRRELLALRTEKANWLRRRHIDLRCLDTVAPFVR